MVTDTSEQALIDYLGDDASNALTGDTNVAVVSEPYGGRDSLVEHAVGDGPNVERVELGPATDSVPEVVSDTSEGTVVVEDCHHLYTREIGGFDAVRDFVSDVAGSDARVVTSWNVFSWRYLERVTEAGSVFTAVESPSLSANELAEYMTRGIDEPDYSVAGNNDIGTVKKTVTVPRFGEIDVPLPRFVNGEHDARDVVFSALRSASGGNIGIAETLWSDAYDDELTDSDFEADAPPELSDDEAFAVTVVISSEAVGRDDLSRTVGCSDAVVRRLADEGLVTIDDGRVHPEPRRLRACIWYLKRRCWLW